MQEVKRTQILPNTMLTCVRTDKFKTCCLSMNLVTKLDQETAAKNALLPRVLLRGTASHTSMEQLSAYMDDLYGARIVPIVRKKGEKHCIGFVADFIDDDFVSPNDKILENAAALLGELLLSPYTEGGMLLDAYVESEKKNLIDDIRAGINDKRSYALDRLYALMCSDEAFGISKLGDEAHAEQITTAILTKHYKTLVSESAIELFYCGAHAPERVEAALINALGSLPRVGKPVELTTDIRLEPKTAQPRTFSENFDVQQGKMTIGFRLGSTMLSPNYAALMVFNAVFGGSVTSKLFMNVREKLSLCYYASSSIEKHKGVMAVSSGVEFTKFGEAYKEVLAQLDAVRHGDISEWELASAKRSVITAIKATMDKPSGLEELFFDQAIGSIKYTPDELAALCDAVSAQEVASIAAEITVDTVYYLAGNMSPENSQNGGPQQ